MPHLEGVKVNVPFWATMTVIFSAQTQAARPRKAERMVAKRISQKKRKESVGRLVAVLKTRRLFDSSSLEKVRHRRSFVRWVGLTLLVGWM